MKVTRISEKTIWDRTRSPSSTPTALFSASKNRALPRFFLCIILFVSITCLAYTLKLIFTPRACNPDDIFTSHTRRRRRSSAIPYTAYPSKPSIKNQTLYIAPPEESVPGTHMKTGLEHIVFGIAASAKLWEKRKNYIKLWWKPGQMRGVVWLDDRPKAQREAGLPPVRISGDTSRFAYTNRHGKRAAIRISRIVSETVQLGMENVRWLVMGDDDTVFVVDNLVRVLSKYDHNQFYYIGSSSESHLQNIYFSYGMAYGGGGFAISYPLAKALETMQDRCIQRYPGLYGSDDRIQACMAELGVPLTRELGFHQYDVHGDLFGLLAAHPVTPFISLHHLDVVEPIFPNLTRLQALHRLKIPMKLDSAGLMQQSICYEQSKGWTVSVSWGFAVQIFRGVLSPREVEMPSRTFLNWYRREDYRAYAFNTRPVSRNPCQKPFVFYFSGFLMNQTVSEFVRHRVAQPACGWKMADPSELDRVQVYKKPDPHLWDRSPRKNCCRILDTKRRSMVVDVGVCRQGEISEIE